MSEKKAEKLMYAIGGVSEEMLKEAEDYSENIKNTNVNEWLYIHRNILRTKTDPKEIKKICKNCICRWDSRSSHRLCITCI